MNRGKLIIAVGLVSILLLLISTGCTADSLKSSQHSSPEEPLTEEVSTADEESTSTDEVDSAEEESTTEDEGNSGDETTTEDDVEAEPTENPETNCSSLNPHPLAESMTEQFEVTYEEVMTWYCDGAAFSDILLALETVDLVDESVEDLLSMVKEDMTWEEIWQELGVEK
jgi:hypothetical protein